MTGGLKMGVNVAAHTCHIFLGSAPRMKMSHMGMRDLCNDSNSTTVLSSYLDFSHSKTKYSFYILHR